jgi:hypothetical protein
MVFTKTTFNNKNDNLICKLFIKKLFMIDDTSDINVNYLTSSDIEFIKKSLSTNSGISQSEWDSFCINHKYVVNPIESDTHIIDCDKKYYGLSDDIFNEFLLKKFAKPEYTLDVFYKLTYNVGDSTIPHLDITKTIQTTIILLTDTFTGGDLIIKNKIIPFNTIGSYVSFKGNTTLHGVLEVTSGKREVLVIWFNKKSTII